MGGRGSGGSRSGGNVGGTKMMQILNSENTTRTCTQEKQLR